MSNRSVFRSARVVGNYKKKVIGWDPSEFGPIAIVSSIAWTDSFVGSENPHWRMQIRNGGNATTVASGVRQFLQNPDNGRFETSYFDGLKTTKQWLSGHRIGALQGFSGVGINNSGALQTAKSKVNKFALEKLRPTTGGVIAGELGKTLKMIRQPARAIQEQVRGYFKKLKKVSPRLSSAQRARALSDTYLEAQYGWKPLFNDIEGAWETLRRYQSKVNPETVTVSGKGETEETSSPFTGTSSPNGDGGVMRVTFTDQEVRKCSVRITAGFRMNRYGSGGVAEALGLYPENWLPTAWELVPYSFLIDYFTNIGKMIDSYSVVNARMIWNCATERRTWTVTRTVKPDMPWIKSWGSGAKLIEWTPAKPSVLTRIEFSRYPLATLVPDLEFSVPEMGSRKSWNIAALLFSNGVKRPFF